MLWVYWFVVSFWTLSELVKETFWGVTCIHELRLQILGIILSPCENY